MAIQNPVTVVGVDENGYSSVDANIPVSRPPDSEGVLEVFDSAAALDADVPTVLTLNNGTNIKMVTVKLLDAVTAGAYTVVSTAEHLYVGFAGTPFNDTQIAGARRVVGLGEERTFVFSDEMPATGVSYAPHADSAINLQQVVVEVLYS